MHTLLERLNYYLFVTFSSSVTIHLRCISLPAVMLFPYSYTISLNGGKNKKELGSSLWEEFLSPNAYFMNGSWIVIARSNQVASINGKSRKTWPNISRSLVIVSHDMKFKGFNIGRTLVLFQALFLYIIGMIC